METWLQSLGEAVQNELTGNIPDLDQAVRVLARLMAAAILGGLVGWQREAEGKEAGLRTLMVVSLAAALFVLVPLEFGRSQPGWNDNIGRVVQGVAAGIGFIGGGVILKLTDKERVRGLTTAASVWLTAAVGVAAALGRYWIAFLGVGLTLIVLAVLRRLERKADVRKGKTELPNVPLKDDL
jgi:putative Mg2+ transporter-C (MgtC) family protein